MKLQIRFGHLLEAQSYLLAKSEDFMLLLKFHSLANIPRLLDCFDLPIHHFSLLCLLFGFQYFLPHPITYILTLPLLVVRTEIRMRRRIC